MSNKSRGTVAYRAGRDGRPGKWWARFTASDGSRPWVELGAWPNSPQGRARAKETAAHHAPRFLAEGFVGTPLRGPKAKTLRTATQTPAGAWWQQYFAHRRNLGIETCEGPYRMHIEPVIDKPWTDVTPADCERLRDALDEKALSGAVSPKTTFNAWTVWATAAKAACGQWKKDKPKRLRVRADNPCVGVVPPDMDDPKELQWLYPEEVLRLISCELVPFEARRVYALAVHLFARAGELKALHWSDVDIERGIVSVRTSYDRATGELKQTKTGNKGIRRFAIEPTVLPLLRAMHAEANGEGPIMTMRLQKWWAADLRKHLEAADITRSALFRSDTTCKRIRFHDLRSTGLTWMAIRGDDPLKIKQRAGHRSFGTTEHYIRTAEAVGEAIGAVFPPLPLCLLSAASGLANRPKDPQGRDIIVEAPGIEDRSVQRFFVNPRAIARIQVLAPVGFLAEQSRFPAHFAARQRGCRSPPPARRAPPNRDGCSGQRYHPSHCG